MQSGYQCRQGNNVATDVGCAVIPIIFISFKNYILIALPLYQLVRPGKNAGTIDLRVFLRVIPGQVLPDMLGQRRNKQTDIEQSRGVNLINFGLDSVIIQGFIRFYKFYLGAVRILMSRVHHLIISPLVILGRKGGAVGPFKILAQIESKGQAIIRNFIALGRPGDIFKRIFINID